MDGTTQFVERDGKLPPECELTTDDLAMMIGEAAIRERQAGKIQRYQAGQVQALAARLLKAESLAVGERSAIEALTADRDASFKSIASLQGRIAQLEDQVHKTALERDAALKDAKTTLALMADLETTIARLQAEAKPKKRQSDKEA